MMTAEKNISFRDIDIKNITHCHLIGIGGIGMSALARYFNMRGKSVSGYDKTKTQLTEKLTEEGISITFKDEINSISEDFRIQNNNSVLVIYTPAIPDTHTQLNFLTESGYTVLKRSQALGLITNSTKGLAVAGTHGKTTTSSILAFILHESGYDISAFLGGIVTDFQSNFIHTAGSQTSVVEADEFDRSFLTLFPEAAIITSTDADHLDIYGEKHALIDSFKEFASQIKKTLVIHESSAHFFSEFPNLKTYGSSAQCDYRLISRKANNGTYTISIQTPYERFDNINLNMPGEHNSLNATAALALAIESGYDAKKLVDSLEKFNGISRRFEFKIKSETTIYIDDYAHHPAELDAAISAARELYPTKKLFAIFQPHLFSRTRDFMDEFAESLSALDELILLDIYPAREKPLDGISSEILLQKITTKAQLLSKTETLSLVQNCQPELLMTLGAGDIDKLVEPIKKLLS